jgi:Icc-related predicted phosphoesterase
MDHLGRAKDLGGNELNMDIVCISDTHSLHCDIAGGVPDGDVLVHAGDHTGANTRGSTEDFLEWFALQPHRHKVFIAGNHDRYFEEDPEWCASLIPDGVTYLQDSGVEIDGVKFWGSPWQPEFCDWHFNLPRGGSELVQAWAKIPSDTDVLITHGPPKGTLDLCPAHPARFRGEMVNVGCEHLATALERVQPKIHIFGHIHEGYGIVEANGRITVNASSVTGRYRPLNPAIKVAIP